MEYRRHRDDLRGLYEFPSRIGAYRADPLDAEPAGLGQIPDRRGRIMAMARLPGRAPRLPGICLRDISPEPAPRGPQGRGVGPRLARPPDAAGDHSRDRLPGAVALRDLAVRWAW